MWLRRISSRTCGLPRVSSFLVWIFTLERHDVEPKFRYTPDWPLVAGCCDEALFFNSPLRRCVRHQLYKLTGRKSPGPDFQKYPRTKKLLKALAALLRTVNRQAPARSIFLRDAMYLCVVGFFDGLGMEPATSGPVTDMAYPAIEEEVLLRTTLSGTHEVGDVRPVFRRNFRQRMWQRPALVAIHKPTTPGYEASRKIIGASSMAAEHFAVRRPLRWFIRKAGPSFAAGACCWQIRQIHATCIKNNPRFWR